MRMNLDDPDPLSRLLDRRYRHAAPREIATPSVQQIMMRRIAELFPRGIERVLFVHVPQISPEHFQFDSAHSARYPCFPPYGPCVLIAALEEAGYEADIIDLHFILLEAATEADSEEAFRMDCWKVPLAEKVELFQPQLIGMSCMFNMGHPSLKETAAFLRATFPGIPLVAGGVHPSLSASPVLNDIPELDFVFLYEAELTLTAFLEVANGRSDASVLHSLAAIIEGDIQVDARHHRPEVLSHAAAYKNLPIQRYSQVGRIGAYTFLRDRSSVAAGVLSRRGCRAQCSFCSVRNVNGAGVRVRDYAAVVDEIELLVRKYGLRHIMWLDDDLFYDREHAIAMFREIERRQLGITWDASNGIIASALNKPLLEACVRSGCVGFNLGIESGNPVILTHMRKPGTVEKFVEAAGLLAQYPQIFTKGFLIFGYPFETIAALRDTVELALRMDLDWYPSQILTPMPGTPVHQLMLDQDDVAGTPNEVLRRSTTLGRGRTFSVGATGSIARREREEMKLARPFSNPFERPSDYVPARDELEDVWVVIDYRVNYEPILTQSDRCKLKKKRLMLLEICERMTSVNPLANLFLGICEHRLGDFEQARHRLSFAEEHLEQSAFWQIRFESLGISDRLRDFRGSLMQRAFGI